MKKAGFILTAVLIFASLGNVSAQSELIYVPFLEQLTAPQQKSIADAKKLIIKAEKREKQAEEIIKKMQN